MAERLPIRRIYIEDVLKGDGEVDPMKLLYSMNLFMEAVYNALDGNLTFNDNVLGQIYETTFTTSSTYTASNTFDPIEFQIKINSKPQGVILLQIYKENNQSAIITEPVSLSWQQKKNKIQIGFITGLADSTKYVSRFLVI